MFILVRKLLVYPILLLERLTCPKRGYRTAENKKAVQADIENLGIYQFLACPFCVKVRRELVRLDLDIPLFDASGNEKYKRELLEGGGRVQVPCLKIKYGDETKWLYESSDIISYLRDRFPLS